MNQAEHYNYGNAATLFTRQRYRRPPHRYHNRLRISLRKAPSGRGAVGRIIVLLNDKGANAGAGDERRGTY